MKKRWRLFLNIFVSYFAQSQNKPERHKVTFVEMRHNCSNANALYCGRYEVYNCITADGTKNVIVTACVNEDRKHRLRVYE